MRRIVVTTVFIVLAFASNAQSYKSNPSENNEDFIKRSFSLEDLRYPVKRIKSWDSTKELLIYLSDFQDQYNNTEQVCYLLTPTDSNSYRRTLIDTLWGEGGENEKQIDTIFFTNADKDKEPELIIMLKAEAHSPRFADNDVEGYYYQTSIYDTPNLLLPKPKLTYLKDISQKFDEELEGKVYNSKSGHLLRREHAKYKTAKAVIAILKNMGY